MSVRDDTRVFHLGQFLGQGEHPVDDSTTAPDLLILNQPISNFVEFSRLWKHTSYHICADGGANRLYDMFVGERESERDNYLPDSIHGDLDSLRNDVRAYYSARGVEVSQDRGQVSTDFGKAMLKISSKQSSVLRRNILILGTLAGRVDQGLGLLHELFREESQDENLRLWLFSETNLSFILATKKTVIHGALSSGFFKKKLGLIPIYGPAVITTKGLEWDVKDWKTTMGTQVSTSNNATADEIHVETSAPILFTIQRAALGSNGKQ